ncbi:hypothetical protein BC936DRAFT_147685 [Jimgerdemannia flammicorona]|uniref:Uncharacterized protein n=1 Tax=Jimgerdemannia flammicorona TaxID=994334 RepID=A0A433D4S0_9FUNG|nr:hypothetical protein BC936DRAFT_147685 [Jimgerdemannia flammicorona]
MDSTFPSDNAAKHEKQRAILTACLNSRCEKENVPYYCELCKFYENNLPKWLTLRGLVLTSRCMPFTIKPSHPDQEHAVEGHNCAIDISEKFIGSFGQLPDTSPRIIGPSLSYLSGDGLAVNTSDIRPVLRVVGGHRAASSESLLRCSTDKAFGCYAGSLLPDLHPDRDRHVLGLGDAPLTQSHTCLSHVPITPSPEQNCSPQ